MKKLLDKAFSDLVEELRLCIKKNVLFGTGHIMVKTDERKIIIELQDEDKKDCPCCGYPLP